jgi:hypothetical protein
MNISELIEALEDLQQYMSDPEEPEVLVRYNNLDLDILGVENVDDDDEPPVVLINVART